MFKSRVHRIAGLSSIVFLFTCFTIVAQVEEHEVPELKNKALKAYAEADYELALNCYKMLMNEYPKDAMFRYYAGICLFHLDKDLEESAELLYFSSTRGVPVDVYYYLGEVHRRLYDFKKAKSYFVQFDREASRSEAKAMNSKLLIRSIVSAMQITSSYNPYEVLNVTFMDLYNDEEVSQVKMRGGVLRTKPKEFFTEGEDQFDLNRLMFMPKKVERGEVVYFSGKEKNGKNGFQIMQARKSNTGKWTDIESLAGINTELDEIMPYFDPVGKDLYFASNGKEGIGGFDLYRSHYDSDRKSWSAPVNLGFPVNSASDDYLLLPGTDLGMVMFFSGRQATDTSSVVYRVHLKEPKQSLVNVTPEEIRRVAHLDDVASMALAEIEEYEMMLDRSHLEGDKKEEKEGSPVIISEAGRKVDEAYQNLLSSAMRHQTVCDSLTELATKARIKVRESDDPNDRWLYQKQIMVWEKKAIEERESADLSFAEVAAYRPSKELPKTIERDTVIRELTVYRFVEPKMVEEKAQKAFSGAKEVEEAEKNEIEKDVLADTMLKEENAMKNQAEKESSEIVQESTEQIVKKETVMRKSEELKEDSKAKVLYINRFDLLASSPYSSGNPIPMDPSLPAGTFYRIQLGVFSQAVEADAFGGLSPVTAERLPERKLIKYYVGKFSKYSDAQGALAEVRNAGYADAFVVSWYNGSKMTTEKAIKLEK